MDIHFSNSQDIGKSIRPSEDKIQQALWKWLAYVKVGKGSAQDHAYMVPNGTYLGGGSPKARARYMAKLKSMGFKVGVSDIVLAYPVAPYAGAYIELKKDAGQGWGLSQDQVDWLQSRWAVGYWVTVSRGLEQSCEDVQRYLNGLDPRDEVLKRLDIKARS